MGGGPSDESAKSAVQCHSRCDGKKICPHSKAISAENRPKVYSPSLTMVTSPDAIHNKQPTVVDPI
jgi:hypothetical protein